MLRNGERVRVVGYLNSWGLSLGSIVEITPGLPASAAVVESHVLTPSSDEISSTSSSGVVSIAVNDSFHVRFDGDIGRIASRDGLDLESDILKHTTLLIYSTTFRSLRDVAASINRDSGLAERVRTKKGTQFAVVSETVDGIMDWGPFYTGSAKEIGESNIHVSYSCSDIDRIGVSTRKTSGATPISVSLMAIRYEEERSQLTIDPRPMPPFRAR